MKVTKKHKLYFKTKKGEVRNLQKVSLNIYNHLIDYFFNKGGNDAYQKKNEKAKHARDLKPLDVVLPPPIAPEMDRLTKEKSIVIYYNGTLRPVAKLFKI